MCCFIPEKIPLRLEANCKKPVILKHIKRKHTRALATGPMSTVGTPDSQYQQDECFFIAH